MSKKPRIATFVGTRPEIIKLSATIKALDEFFDHILIHTGQHYNHELDRIFFEDLNIRLPDHYLEANRLNPASCIADIIQKSDALLRQLAPAAILIYGDTNSALCAYTAKRQRIPIFHMEAGNRCFDPRVPEEVNRRIVDHLSDVNMTISEQARDNLLREGLRSEFTFKIGSSMPEVLQAASPKIETSQVLKSLGLAQNGYYLMSIHREENVSRDQYMEVLLDFLDTNALDAPVVFSAHPRFRQVYGDRSNKNTVMCEPFGFSDYVHLQTHAKCVISDSGSLMEESALLGFPAVTIRDSHERPEAMESASVTVSSWDADHIKRSIGIAVARSIHMASRPDSEGHSVPDYLCGDTVSIKVLNIISSYIHQIDSKVWFK